MSKLYLTISIFFFAVQFGQTQSTDLFIQKTGPTQCYVGESITYTIVIENLGNSAADGATFNDNFPTNVSNVTLTSCTAANGAVCPGSYTLNNSNFSGTIPTLPVGGTVTFVLTMRSPVPFSGGSFSNTATCSPPSGTTELDPNTNSSTWNTTQLSDIDLKVVQLSVDNNTPFNCNALPRSYTYTIRWVNAGPSVAYNCQLANFIRFDNANSVGSGNFTATYGWAITNLQWSATGTTAVPTSQFNPMSGSTAVPNPVQFAEFYPQIAIFGVGDTLTLTYTFTINSITSTGCGRSWSWDMSNGAYAYTPAGYTEINGSNNGGSTNISGNTCAGDDCPTIDLKVIQLSVDNNTPFNCNALPRSYTYTIRWVNAGPSVAYNCQLANFIRFDNANSVGSGNFTATYGWAITNLQWSATGTTAVPTSQFNPMSGSTAVPNPVQFAEFYPQIASFGVGDTLTLTYTFTINSITSTGCGRSWSWDMSNGAYAYTPAGYIEINGSNNGGSTNISGNTCAGDDCPTIDLKVIQLSVDNNTSLNCVSLPQSYNYTIRWVNAGPSVAYNCQLANFIRFDNANSVGSGNFTATYGWAVTNLQWSATGATAVPTSQFNPMSGSTAVPNPVQFAEFYPQIASFGVGDTLTLTYTFTINSVTNTGCGRSWSWDMSNGAYAYTPAGYIEINGSNNGESTNISGNTISATDLAISKSLTPSIVNTGDTIQFSVEFQNTSSGVTNPAVWVDTIPEGVEIDINSISCTPIVGSPPCGTITYDSVARTLTQTIANMPSNSGVRVTYNLLVTEKYSKTIPSKAYAIHPCIDCNLSSNYTQTNFAIVGRCDYKYAGTDGFTEVCQSNNALNLIDYLFAPGKIDPGIGGEWNRTSGSGGVFDAPSGTFVPAKGATNSDFTYIFAADAGCLADTSYMRVSILPCVLPVDLLYFEAFSTDKQTVTLQWATASETNTDYFTIERSQNAIDWYSVTNVKAAGNSATATYYETIDPTPLGGLLYYRLKQIDTDGTFSYGFIKAVTRNENSAVVVFPNPASDKINILTDVSPFGVEIINIYGQTVLTSDNKNEISLSQLSNGTYVIKVMAPGGAIHIEKLIIR